MIYSSYLLRQIRFWCTLLLISGVPYSLSTQTLGRITLRTSRSEGEILTLYTRSSESFTLHGAERMSTIINEDLLESQYRITASSDLALEGDLSYLNITDNRITYIDISQAPTLHALYCDLNEITQIEFGSASALQELDCSDNRISQLDLQGLVKLENLFCNNNNLSTLDLSHTPLLQSLFCNNNSLEQITLQGNNRLVDLYAMSNNLRTLDLQQAPNLSDINLRYNQFEDLDLTSVPHIKRLNLAHNRLTSIDLRRALQLFHLQVEGNRLTELRLSPDTPLRSIYCSSNQLSGESVHQLINGLPHWDRQQLSPEEGEGDLIVIDSANDQEGNICYTSDVQLAQSKGWRVMDLNGNFYARKPYPGSSSPEQPTNDQIALTLHKPVGEPFCIIVCAASPISAQGMTEISNEMSPDSPDLKRITYRLDTQSVQITGQQISILWINQQQVETLDLTHAPHLQSLQCRMNGLTRLTLGELPELVEIQADQNLLTEIDLSHLPALDFIELSENRLTTLDFSHTPHLLFAATVQNQIHDDAMTQMIHSLPTLDPTSLDRDELEGCIVLSSLDSSIEGNRATTSDIALGHDKHWIFYAETADRDFVEYEGEPNDLQYPNSSKLRISYIDTLEAWVVQGTPPESTLLLRNLAGHPLSATRSDCSGVATISARGLPTGTYLLTCGSDTYKLIR